MNRSPKLTALDAATERESQPNTEAALGSHQCNFAMHRLKRFLNGRVVGKLDEGQEMVCTDLSAAGRPLRVTANHKIRSQTCVAAQLSLQQ